MKLIKRILAEIHLAFVGLFDRKSQYIPIPKGEQIVKTPLGDFNVFSQDVITKATVTWYGVRKVISYWRQTDDLVLGSTVWSIDLA